MSEIGMRDPEQARWGELVDRLVTGVTNLATDRIRLAGLEARQAAERAMVVAGLFAAAAIIGLIGFIFLCLGLVALLSSPDVLGPVGGWLVVALVLLLLSAGIAAAAVWTVKSRAAPTAGPAETPAAPSVAVAPTTDRLTPAAS